MAEAVDKEGLGDALGKVEAPVGTGKGLDVAPGNFPRMPRIEDTGEEVEQRVDYQGPKILPEEDCLGQTRRNHECSGRGTLDAFSSPSLHASEQSPSLVGAPLYSSTFIWIAPSLQFIIDTSRSSARRSSVYSVVSSALSTSLNQTIDSGPSAVHSKRSREQNHWKENSGRRGCHFMGLRRQITESWGEGEGRGGGTL